MAMLKYHTTSTTVGSSYRTKSSERNSQTRHARSSAISAEKYKDFGTLKAARVISERIDEEDKNSAAGDDDDGDDPVRASRRIANANKKRNFLMKTILD